MYVYMRDIIVKKRILSIMHYLKEYLCTYAIQLPQPSDHKKNSPRLVYNTVKIRNTQMSKIIVSLSKIYN